MPPPPFTSSRARARGSSGLPPNRACTIRSSSTTPAASVSSSTSKAENPTRSSVRPAILLNLDHRGACGCEANTGDGAGILIQMPHEFLKLVAKEGRVTLSSLGEYGVGMLFLPPDAAQRAECEKIVGQIVAEEGQKLLGWRTVPDHNATLGKTARAAEPLMRQFFIGRNAKLTDDLAFERKLYVIRKRAEQRNSLLRQSCRRQVFLRLRACPARRSSIKACS